MDLIHYFGNSLIGYNELFFILSSGSDGNDNEDAMIELSIGVIYLENIQQNEHKHNSMSCPRVHARAAIRPHFHSCCSNERERNSFIQRPAGVATVGPLVVTTVTLLRPQRMYRLVEGLTIHSLQSRRTMNRNKHEHIYCIVLTHTNV